MERKFPESDGRSSDPLYHPENRKRVLDALAQVQSIADRHGVTLANLVVSWVIHQPGITGALVGARTAEQAIENAKAGHIQLDVDELASSGSLFWRSDQQAARPVWMSPTRWMLRLAFWLVVAAGVTWPASTFVGKRSH